MRPFLILYFLILSALQLAGQEELLPLMYNESLREKLESESFDQLTRDIERKPFIYTVDTIVLPFFDDFTKDATKIYRAEKIDDNISLKVLFGFTVNDEHPEYLDLVYEPTYSKTKPISGPIQLDVNPTLYVTFYDELGERTTYDTGWTNIITEFDEGLGLVSYDTLAPNKTYQNTFDTLYIVADDNSNWITPGNESNRGGAYINNNLQDGSLTQGVASFDGTDALGEPYNITSETAYGPADTLESKPFRLEPEMADVFLSFFFQEGGHGNAPEIEDTLVLEFFDVTSKAWRHVWSQVGGSSNTGVWSAQVLIRIKELEYLQPGFQFRFRNYATLSGAFDMWHIDYVRLDENRDSASADTIIDVSILTNLTSFTGEYTSVPYDHYLENVASLQADTVNLDVRNLGTTSAFVQNINFEITDDQNNQIYFFTTSDLNLPGPSFRKYNFITDAGQVFPDQQTDIAEFDITTWYTISGNNSEFVNDTIRSVQKFAKYYAYDDGSAEQAYALTGAGIELAYEFVSPKGDSLKGLWINFPKVLIENVEDFDLELLVWTDTASDPIYTSEIPISPIYSGANSFSRYDFDKPVFIQGTFYVGFRQLQSDKIYVGFDKNTNSRNHILYRTGDKWFQSSFDGSLLLRPDFGVNPFLGLKETTLNSFDIGIYPNPTKKFAVIEPLGLDIQINIYTLNGQLMLTNSLSTKTNLNLGRFPPGVYLMTIMKQTSGETISKKLVITQ